MNTNTPEDAEIIVQKIPCDVGIHRNARKGTLDAPEKILEDFEFGRDVLVDEVFPDEFSLENTQRRIEANTEELLDYGKPLLSVGGDHSVSFPIINLLKRENPDMKLVWLDSHLDLKEKIDSHVSHDVVVRELLSRGFSEDEIVFVGITRKDEDEKEFLEGRDFSIYGPDELDEFKREFDSNEQPVYLSVDIDVLDKVLAPGTGYADGELDLDYTEEIIEAADPDFADLVEVAPSLDEDGKTLDSSRAILENLIRHL